MWCVRRGSEEGCAAAAAAAASTTAAVAVGGSSGKLAPVGCALSVLWVVVAVVVGGTWRCHCLRCAGLLEQCCCSRQMLLERREERGERREERGEERRKGAAAEESPQWISWEEEGERRGERRKGERGKGERGGGGGWGGDGGRRRRGLRPPHLKCNPHLIPSPPLPPLPSRCYTATSNTPFHQPYPFSPSLPPSSLAPLPSLSLCSPLYPSYPPLTPLSY